MPGYTNITKPTGATYTNIAKPGGIRYIGAGMKNMLMMPLTNNRVQTVGIPYTSVNKPTGASYTNIAKPT